MTTNQNNGVSRYTMTQGFALMLIISFFSLLQSCNDTIDTGAELFDQEVRAVKVDSLTCGAINVSEDVVESYNPYAQAIIYPLGIINDPAIGKMTAAINMQFLPRVRPDTATFKGATLIDVKMYARFATSKFNFPGSYDKDQTVEVYQLADSLSRIKTYKSDIVIASKPKLLGSTTINLSSNKLWPNTFDPNLPKPLEIELDKQFGQDLMNIPPTTYALDQLFQREIKGLCLKPGAQNSAMLYMDLVDKILAFGDNDRTRIELRYKKGADTLTLKYFVFNTATSGCAKVNKYEFLKAATLPPIDSLSSADYLYLTAPVGPNVKIKLPNLAPYKDKIIAKAEIEFTVALDKVGNGFLDHLPTQLVFDDANDGVENYISDVGLGSNLGFKGFGGQPIVSTDAAGKKLVKYRFNVSDYIQKAVRPPYAIKDFYLAYHYKSEIAGSVVFYGTSHPTYAPKLRVVYSNIK
jgi:hypothetical protein